MTTIEIIRIVITITTITIAEPNKPTDFDEYKAFLDASYQEAEEPCEISQDSNNPLLTSWFQRHCL